MSLQDALEELYSSAREPPGAGRGVGRGSLKESASSFRSVSEDHLTCEL